MPMLVYRCSAGHVFEALVLRADRSDAPVACIVVTGRDDVRQGDGRCDGALRLQIAAPAAFPGADSWRR